MRLMGNDYYKGVFAAYLGTGFMSHPIPEWQIDMIKENLSHFCEAQIDHSLLSYQEKEEQKRQMKLSLEVYIQGVKDGNILKGIWQFCTYVFVPWRRPKDYGKEI
jgi:hypothetical protein